MRLIALTLACLAFVMPAAAQDRRASHCIALVQNTPGLSLVHKASFRAPLEDFTVRLSFLGHAMFLLQTPGGESAVTDYTGFLGTVDFVPSVATMNRAHSTHWTNNPDPRIPHVLPGWDFETAGLCIGHLGHLHHEPTPEQYAALGRLDVVMVPVDGGYTMDVTAMMRVVQRLRSSIVVPMHWFGRSTLEFFIAEMSGDFAVQRLDRSWLEVSLRSLPSRPTIMLLEPALLRRDE